MNDIKFPPVPSLIAERDWHEAFKQYGRDTVLLNQKPETKPWPQHGDVVTLLYNDGSITSKYGWESSDEGLAAMFAQGNLFPTNEAAIKERDRRIVIQRLRALAGEVNLHTGEALATIYYSESSGSWSVTYHEAIRFPGTVYFNTTQEAHEAVVVIGIDELNKLLP